MFRCRFRITFVVIAASTAGPWLYAQDPPESRIYWTQSADQAMSLAQRFELPILVYATSDNCGYCRKLEREVWGNPDIISLVEDGYIPLELNAEQNGALVAALGIRAFPTTLIVSPDGQLLHAAAGYQRPTQMAAILRGGAPGQAIPPQPVTAEAPARREICWQHSAETAVELARQSRLPIVVFVTSDNCGPCRKMAHEVWDSPEVVAMVETSFIPLVLNAERDADVVSTLNLVGFPTTILYSPDAEYLTSAVGYLEADQLSALLRTVEQSAMSHKTVQSP